MVELPSFYAIHPSRRVTRRFTYVFYKSFPCLHIFSSLNAFFGRKGKYMFWILLYVNLYHDPTLFSSCHALFLTTELHMMGWLILQFSEHLLQGLKRVSWEKVDVSFHNSKVRSAAHSVIQVLPLPPGGVLSYSEVKFASPPSADSFSVNNLATPAHKCLWKIYWGWSLFCNEILTGKRSCDA